MALQSTFVVAMVMLEMFWLMMPVGDRNRLREET